MIRRSIRQFGLLSLARWGWKHRGSMVRAADLLRRAPQLVQSGRTGDMVTELRAVVALDQDFPTATDVRITGIDDGSITLRDTLAGPELEAARGTLCSVRDVLDVRTVGADHPTLDDAMAAAGR